MLAAIGATGCGKAPAPEGRPPAAPAAQAAAPDGYGDAGRFRNDVRTNAEVAAGVLDVTLSDAQGKPVDLRQYRGKKNVVLVVMRGYPGFICPNCSAQTSRLVSNHDEFVKRNAQVLVLFPGPTDHVGEFIAKAGATGHKAELPFPVLPDVDAVASAASARLIRDMLAAEPDKRVATYQELLRRIEEVTAAVSGPAPAAACPARPDARARRPQPRWVRWVLPAFAALLVTPVLVFHAYPRLVYNAGPAEARPFAARRVEPLFDGVSLQGWQPVSGSWKAARDAEGGRVLAGRGVIARRLRQAADYRVTVNVDLHDTTAVELLFGVTEPSGPRYALFMTREAATLVRRDGDRGPPVTLASKPLPARNEDEVSPYQQLRAERRSGVWFAYVGLQQVGEAQPAQAAERAEVRLAANGGTAYFESPEAADLVAETVGQR